MTAYILTMAALVVGAYFFGNINISIIISRIRHRDVRNIGSGNPGTMNMLRGFGIRMGVLTLVMDAIKGAVPAILGWWLLASDPSGMFMFTPDKTGAFIGGISAVIGHIFPVVFGFKGGKGVATSIGVCFVVEPLVALAAFIIGVVFLLTVKVGSLTSFIMTGAPLIYCSATAFMGGDLPVGIMSASLYAIILIAHRSNFVRIFKGEEKLVVLFGKNKSARKIAEEERLKSESEESGESGASEKK